MTSYQHFKDRCQLRHDFSDMFQVRYTDPGGESFDTWVSGQEALSRLTTQARETLLRDLGTAPLDQIGNTLRDGWESGLEQAGQNLRDRLANAVADQLGDNLISETIGDRLSGTKHEDPRAAAKANWNGRLKNAAFREEVLKLAWINLDGSLPDSPGPEADDWS